MFSKEFWMSYKGLVVVLALCAVVFGGGYWWTLWQFGGKANERGDAAGLVNGLFSALAFAGVIYAIFLQRHELELQRGELEDQKKEFRIQNATLKRQRFENTFFNMLQMQHQITDNLRYFYLGKVPNPAYGVSGDQPKYIKQIREIEGRGVFVRLYEPKDRSENDAPGVKQILKEKGINGYDDYAPLTALDHYFRHLYHIFKFIDRSDLIDSFSEKKEYAAMAMSQLSRHELVFLYYNGLSAIGRNKLKPLIERLGLLENLRRDLLVEDFQCDIDYAPSAWGSRDGA